MKKRRIVQKWLFAANSMVWRRYAKRIYIESGHSAQNNIQPKWVTKFGNHQDRFLCAKQENKSVSVVVWMKWIAKRDAIYSIRCIYFHSCNNPHHTIAIKAAAALASTINFSSVQWIYDMHFLVLCTFTFRTGDKCVDNNNECNDKTIQCNSTDWPFYHFLNLLYEK